MNIPLKRLLPLALLALLILLIICFIGDIGRVQGKLRNNSHAALTEAGCNFAKEDIRFSGRNGVISGKISESDRNFVLDTVRNVRGVNRRGIKGDFTIDSNAGCSSRVATTTPPATTNAIAPAITTVASTAALAPALAPIIQASKPAAAPVPTCRVLSADERQALQNELNAITEALPEERFAVGNLSVSPGLGSHLESAVSVLSQDNYRNAAVNIVGYTESGLLPDYNQCLSSGRANSVRQYLVANGIDARCLSVSAAGGNNALASSDTADGRRLNRRIEFVVQEVE